MDAMQTNTYKQLESKKMKIPEINEIAWELAKKYKALEEEAYKKTEENPIPDINDPDFDTKSDIHHEWMITWSRRSQLYHAVFSYALCRRRSLQMGCKLVSAITEALDNGETVY